MTSDHTLVLEAIDSGFFSNVNCVVNHLHHSLGRDGCCAIHVDWRPKTGDRPYFTYGTRDDGNLWDQFFEPLHFPRAPETEVRTASYADYSMTGRAAYEMYKLDRGWRERFHRAYSQYIRIRRPLVERAEAAGERMEGKFCVGVHFRHPIHSYEEPRPAPGFVKHALWARRVLPKNGQGTVVLATDVTECADYFREVFGERLVLQSEVDRVSLADAREVHQAPAAPRRALGEQVLIDALLLSRCQVLIHNTSNITTAVGYMNPSLRMLFCEPLFTGIHASMRMRLQTRVPRESTAGLRTRTVIEQKLERTAEWAWLMAQRRRATIERP